MSTVLNPALYHRLQRLFGRVEVANPGEAMIFKALRNPLTEEPRLDISQSGEQYRVSCPYCNDTRFRLYVSHMWGQRDDFGRRMTFLVKCFNEDCLAKPQNREDFIETLEESDGGLEEARVRPGSRLTPEAREVHWPGKVTRIDELPGSHRACEYLASRGFDPHQIGRIYGVSYCTESHFYLAENRIIIPVFDQGKLKGWQARYVGELPWKDKDCKRNLPPKYWSCPNSQFRSQCVYNFDRMKQWQTGVIVEGPTDVWRFGAMAGCVFGNFVTEVQQRRLLAVFRKRTLVLLLDPEEFESASTRRAIKLFIDRIPGRFCAVKLPKGTDPGSLGREFLREYVAEHAKDQGVKVIYRKCG